ncbi:hypothetical protein LGM71_21000 [Burkholderia sp. AU33545]|uniref:hypothetical protein n=1 Tax=Burkholderia sp. AU33545 TaxID=2879631 RepID=UPI001CF48981|nr:hypothetical protein [Burkholderia sp. AU33545]MCA8203532.1 hypothetical protein [Burkholderia sp. AU33545]
MSSSLTGCLRFVLLYEGREVSERSPTDQLLSCWSNDRIRDSRCQGDTAAFDDALRHDCAERRAENRARQGAARWVRRG